MGLAPSPKLKKIGPQGLKDLDFEFCFVGNKTDRNSKQDGADRWYTRSRDGQKPRPLKLENKMAPDVAFVRICVVSDNGGMAYMSKQA